MSVRGVIMNREQKRKEARKNKNININYTNDSNKEIYRLLKIAIVVIIIFALLFFGVSLFLTKEIDLSKKDNDTTDTGSTGAILANSIFKQKEDTYYVYFYDFNNENTSIATSIINRLQDKKVYYVDTSDILNKNYVGESINKDAKNLEDLKVVKDTIIKIENDKIVAYYEGEEDITNNLK